MMKKLCFFFFIPAFFICLNFKLESRQYNMDYLMDLIERGDEEEVKRFLSQPKYVTKLKHIVEFTELFRKKVEERFGYSLSYREAYDFFKSYIHNTGFPKAQKKQLLAIFKAIVEQSEKAERKGRQLGSVTMDFKESRHSDFDLPEPMVIAYNEALGGALMCIIPSPMFISQGVGIGMMIDAARRTYDYLDNRSSQNDFRDYSDHCVDRDESHRDYNRDSWDKEY